MSNHGDSLGSKWHRWDPHLHTPGTVLNNQYQGPAAWEEFLTAIENSSPQIHALGITDYYSLDAYELVLEKKNQGRLENVGLIFPNIEMRYGIGTGKGSPINLHLLVSPEDADHVEHAKRFLRAFTFDAAHESFRCDRADLIRLGRAYDRSIVDDFAALEAGTNQFKINPDQLREEWGKSAWARENILVAVASGSGDGTAGLQGDASLATLRKEIERFAHIIFSGQVKPRLFWLGQGPASLEELNSDYGGCKPCLHGSDAHATKEVGSPELNRYCWIKGDLSFESLRQACIEPDTRTFIGETSPRGALPSQVITAVSVSDAPWLRTPHLPLNSGLVGIIGARGSGKTALADIIAAGGLALSSHISERSFVRRASPYLGESAVELTWEAGDATFQKLRMTGGYDRFDTPRVRYLSQQFVDSLCSAEGVTDELLAEIERVIYDAHPPEDRMGTTTFDELLDLRASRGRSARECREADLAEATKALNLQRELQAKLPTLKAQRAEKLASLAKDKFDRTALIGKGGEERAKEFDLISAAAEGVRSAVEQARRKHHALLRLRDAVAEVRNQAPTRLRQWQYEHAEAGLDPQAWSAFRSDFIGNVDDILKSSIATIDERIRILSGPGPGEIVLASDKPPSQISLLPKDVEIASLTLSLLDKERGRLRLLIGIDAERTKAFARLNEKISRDEAALKRLEREIELANKSADRIRELIQDRRDAYAAVFDGIIEEERELSGLYEPLKTRLSGEEGALGKLSFSIRRIVDSVAWAESGEELLDLRKSGPFKGKGALLEAANRDLLSAWQHGSSADVAEAMASFRDSHEHDLVAHSPVERSNPDAFRDWAHRISSWLYGTDHITLAYGVQYEGVDIEQLSPGTRGIVLLLLYLAIDRDDDRPLLIDQPEENLDPKSIFDELVGRFRVAKLRRQIIIVTHNANLIVNTDADQVIVAKCGPHRPGQLPEISYQSGGLENPEIRRQVCDILEGGAAAFKERARRLRVRL